MSRASAIHGSGPSLVAASVAARRGCAPAPERGRRADAAAEYCVRMVTNSGGLEDRSFNQSSWEGLQQAERRATASTPRRSSRPARPTSRRTSQQAVDSGCELIVTVGCELADATLGAGRGQPRPRVRDRRRDGRGRQRQAGRLRHGAGVVPRRLPRGGRVEDRRRRDVRRRQPAARDPVHGRVRRRRRQVQRGARHRRCARSGGTRRSRTARSPATSRTSTRARR